MKLEQIKEQTLRHISRLSYYLDMSDEDRLKAYDFCWSVIYDYHRIYEPYTKITLADVSHFFDVWFDTNYKDEEKCLCGLPLSLNGKNCYSHMTQGY